ncbi:hypothetical protein A5634_20595 [Mycobacterium asiaticum]|uniref:Uncharacterized protein n=1 Tax=Mycobacterium asiaticum TaxID=1790 RepID=A0A1A3P4T8_MYCAS|nr:hypothetical protein [Mycobacterium asiaticum]OBK28309.1 hypothetical protein A5634_20595 [Mycobacterium asiaticum]
MLTRIHGGAGGLLVAAVELLGIVLATALWVYADARAHAGRGRPVVSSVGSLQLTTPVAWFLGCLVLWETIFPHYIDMRGGA